jgi:hypothetical protein
MAGYGRRHHELRLRLLPAAIGTLCSRCGLPMLDPKLMDLDHTDDRKGYKGFSHRACNRSTAGPNAKGIGEHVESPRARSATRW